MITVQFMKPFYTKISGSTLRLVFAYQYFSIIKDDEVYHFIPIDGKEMIVNLNTMQVENLSDVFVFQRGNRFMRLPLYQLLLVSNVHEYLKPILNETTEGENFEGELEEATMEAEIVELIFSLEEANLSRLIDNALEQRNEELFYDLMTQLDKLNGGYAH